MFHDLPEPVLGAIVLMAAKHLVKVEELKEMRAASRVEFRIALIALVGVLASGLLNGLLLAALGSLIALLARASRPPVVALARDATGRFVNCERLEAGDETPGALVLRSAGAWFYFNAEHIRRRILELVERAPGSVRVVVLDCSTIPTIDLNASTSLRALSRAIKARGATLHLAELRDDIAEELRKSRAEDDIGPIVAHRTIEQCLAAG